MAQPHRVLISAFVGSDNLGDEAIFLSLAERLAAEVGGGSVSAASIKPEKTTRLLRNRNRPGLAQIRVTRRVWLALDILRHEVCIFGGGGIIQDQSSILNMVYFLVQISLARMLGKRVVLAFVGVDPLRTKFGRAWTRMALSGIPMCIVRDEESREALRVLGVTGTDIRCAADIAINLECAPGGSAETPVSAPYVLLCLRHWYGQGRLLTPASMKSGPVKDGTRMGNLLNGLARELVVMLDREKDLRIVAVPFFNRRDALVHQALFDRLPSSHKARVELRGAIADPCEYVTLAESARCVIGMRLHALILASLSGTPLVALAYSSKVASFMKQLSLDDQVIDIQSRPDVGPLTDCMNAALERRNEAVRLQVDALRQINHEVLDEVCRLIQAD